MKDKIIKTTRWILFIPVSFLVACIFVYIFNFQLRGSFFETYINAFCTPFLHAIIFYSIAKEIIPSTLEVKQRLPIILILIGNVINFLLFVFYFYMITKMPEEFKLKYIFSFCSITTIIVFCFYILTRNKIPEDL